MNNTECDYSCVENDDCIAKLFYREDTVDWKEVCIGICKVEKSVCLFFVISLYFNGDNKIVRRQMVFCSLQY